MKILTKIFDRKIGNKIKISSYFKQSSMASLFLLLFLLVWHQFIPIYNQVLFSAIASSTFLTFISVNIYQDLSTKIIGGQIVGVIVGIFLWHIKTFFLMTFGELSDEILIVFIALSVGLSMLAMSVLNLEHPPAAGTAMAFVFNPNTPVIADGLLVIIAASLLGLIHFYLKKQQLLKNLN